MNNTIPFLRKYDFDGLDLDWEFPGWEYTGGDLGQRENFSLILQVNALHTGMDESITSG